MSYKMATYFKRSELVCKCGCDACDMDDDFLTLLDAIRHELDRPTYISSGFRCQEHNKAVGGSPRSYHLKGMAADIVCIDADDRYKIVAAAIKCGARGIGIEKLFVHVDNRREGPKKVWSY